VIRPAHRLQMVILWGSLMPRNLMVRDVNRKEMTVLKQKTCDGAPLGNMHSRPWICCWGCNSFLNQIDVKTVSKTVPHFTKQPYNSWLYLSLTESNSSQLLEGENSLHAHFNSQNSPISEKFYLIHFIPNQITSGMIKANKFKISYE
jgi:hypothetical protein